MEKSILKILYIVQRGKSCNCLFLVVHISLVIVGGLSLTKEVRKDYNYYI